jgi:transcriptional regulator with GAF, ATPase, and Fis domain
MSLVAFSVPQSAGAELDQFERLVGAVSSLLSQVAAEDLPSAVGGALERIARASASQSVALIEFDEAGGAGRVHAWPPDTDGGAADAQTLVPGALLERLVRNEVVSVAGATHLPRGARGAADHAARALLGVPVKVAGRVVCALVISPIWSAFWRGSEIERLRIVAELLGVALERGRQDAALRASLATIERLNARLSADTACLQEESETHHDFDDIVGESAALRLALTRLGQVAPLNASVLLLGETGTGKELFARAVHDRSRRQARALVRVNCAALPPALVESELFGHEKGAFTGAVSMRQGRFELADGGTIFLDEIGDLAPEIQVKLLRVLQEGEFERVGSSRTRRVDVRVIAATHRDLEAEVAAGRFRSDLYYRLCVFPIVLPPLRERREDIANLVWLFIHRHQRELGRRISKVPQAVMRALEMHAWPGNVRELGNVIERAMILSERETLRLDPTFGQRRLQPDEAAPPAEERLDTILRAHIESVLGTCGWRINGANNAAARLGVHPNTLRFRMKKLGISRRVRIV